MLGGTHPQKHVGFRVVSATSFGDEELVKKNAWQQQDRAQVWLNFGSRPVHISAKQKRVFLFLAKINPCSFQWTSLLFQLTTHNLADSFPYPTPALGGGSGTSSSHSDELDGDEGASGRGEPEALTCRPGFVCTG